MRRNVIIIKFLVPFLLVALAAPLLAVVVGDDGMEVFPLEHRQEQVAEHRQSKWLIEKFKRQKPPKSHYGKPKSYFKAPKPQYSVPTVPTAPQYSQPIAPPYSPPQENYPQNSFQSSYQTPSFELSQLPISLSSPNYFENPSPFNPPADYRQPEAFINAPQPEYHPVQQQPFIQQLPEVPPSNPNQYQHAHNPPQAAYRQPEVINTTPDYNRLPPTSNSPSQTAYNSQESSAAYQSQELPDHSAPHEESKILPQPEVTNNQYLKQLPFIHQQPYAGTANNNYQQQQPEPGTESYRETANPPRQPQVVNVVQQPYRNPVSSKIPQQPHPSHPVPVVNNPPQQQPYAAVAQVAKIIVPVLPSNGEGINKNAPQQPQIQTVNNIPSRHQTNRKPVSPPQQPQQPYTQAVHHAPQQQTYLELTKNNSPEEFGDYLNQPVYTESPQNPLQTSTNGDNGYDSQNNFPPPPVEDNNEQNYFSPPQPATIYDDESPVNSPILSPKEPANSGSTDDVFSPPANPEIPPLFYNDFAPTEKVKSVKDSSDEGFFEFGIFPKSNSFFLQNYKG